MHRIHRKRKSGEPSEGYEGKEHVKYKDPGYAKHKVRIPEDEPKMKSYVSVEEGHEMEDNYHMDTPDQTPKNLEKNIKRAHMIADEPFKPPKITGDLVTKTGKAIEDDDGMEEMGPETYQKDEGDGEGKAKRKRVVAAFIKRKMKKR